MDMIQELSSQKESVFILLESVLHMSEDDRIYFHNLI